MYTHANDVGEHFQARRTNAKYFVSVARTPQTSSRQLIVTEVQAVK